MFQNILNTASVPKETQSLPPVTPPAQVETLVELSSEATPLQGESVITPTHSILKAIAKFFFRLLLLSALSLAFFYYFTHATFENESLLLLQEKIMGAKEQGEKIVEKKLNTTPLPVSVIPVVETNENAFEDIKKIEGLDGFFKEERQTLTTLFKIGTGELWDETLARNYLEKNKEALAFLSDASKKKVYQDPVFATISKLTVSDLKIDTNLIKNINTLSNIDFRVALKDSQEGRTKELILQRLSFTNLLINARGDKLSSVQGSSIKNQALLQLTPLLASARPLTKEDSLYWEKTLSSFTLPASSYSRFLEVEADMFSAMGEIALDEVMAEQSDPKVEKVVTEGMRSSYADFLSATKIYSEEIAKPCTEISEASIKEKVAPLLVKTGPNKDLETFFSERVELFLEPILLDTYRKCNDALASSAATALVAIKAYADVASSTPNTLEDLVPDFLSTLPLDPYSGKLLNYSKEKGYIYSVGIDKKDDGGSADTSLNWQKMNDPTFPLINGSN
jgi:hypothetical protein